MAKIRDILKQEGWGKAEGWRAFHYFVAQTFAPGLAVALCSESQISMEVPADGFWPVPPRSIGGSDDGEGFGACDICKLASAGREWKRDGVEAALIASLRAMREALGPDAVAAIDFHFSGQITPEVVCDALGQLQRRASQQRARLQRVEGVLATFQLARAGLAFLMASDGSGAALTAFAPEVVAAQIKTMKGAAIE